MAILCNINENGLGWVRVGRFAFVRLWVELINFVNEGSSVNTKHCCIKQPYHDGVCTSLERLRSLIKSESQHLATAMPLRTLSRPSLIERLFPFFSKDAFREKWLQGHRMKFVSQTSTD